jgi:NADH-quinone oxidoreductase subunit C
MTPDEVGVRLAALAGDGASYTVTFGEVTVDVPAAGWVAAATAARDDPDLAATFFDWLSAVDETDGDPPGFSVVTHLYSPDRHHHVLLRTRVPRDAPEVASLTGVFAGAGWHERETAEMFGITFTGHPDPKPLLLPDGFEGHPLRKDFVLAARVAKEWPGAREPGESHAGGPRRARMRPPGVPDPSRWGPGAARGAGGGQEGGGDG